MKRGEKRGLRQKYWGDFVAYCSVVYFPLDGEFLQDSLLDKGTFNTCVRGGFEGSGRVVSSPTLTKLL